MQSLSAGTVHPFLAPHIDNMPTPLIPSPEKTRADSSTPDFNLKPGETIAQYNARVMGPTSGVNLATAKPDAPVTRYTDTAQTPTRLPGDTSGSAPAVPGTPTRYDSAAASEFAPGGTYDSSVKAFTPEEEQTIRNQQRTLVQSQIDTINEMANQELATTRTDFQGKQGQNRARLAATGQLGSGGESTSVDQITADQKKAEDLINTEKAAKTNALLAGVEDRASALIEKQKTTSRDNADKYLAYLKDTSTSARNDMLSLAKAGATLSDSQKQKLMEQTGYDSATFDSLYKSQQIANSADYINKDKPEIVGNKAVFFKQTKDPLTGKVTLSTETLDLPIPAGTDPKNIDVVSRDDGIYVLNKTDGTYKKVGQPSAAYNKAMNPGSDGNDTAQSLAQDLVEGRLSPSELPKRTTGKGVTYDAVLKAATDYSMSAYGKKFNIAQADRDYKFAQRPQTQDTLKYLSSLVGNDEKDGGNLGELKRLSNSINRTSFPALNDAAAWARFNTGDPSIAAYYATATEVADQVAKILQGGGTGSGTSDAKLAQANALFQKGFSKAQFNAVLNAITPLLKNRAKSIIGDNPYLSDYADKFGFQQTRAGATSGADEYKGAQSAKVGDTVTIDGKKYKKTGADAYVPL